MLPLAVGHWPMSTISHVLNHGPHTTLLYCISSTICQGKGQAIDVTAGGDHSTAPDIQRSDCFEGKPPKWTKLWSECTKLGHIHICPYMSICVLFDVSNVRTHQISSKCNSGKRICSVKSMTKLNRGIVVMEFISWKLSYPLKLLWTA